ncbi:MAG: hypothetical protein H7255_18130 [Ramlibacter sp.]|nr:hypothetical protein [Ramlibacter sp.]
MFVLDESPGFLAGDACKPFAHFDRIRRLGLPTLMVTHDKPDAHAAGGPAVTIQ